MRIFIYIINLVLVAGALTANAQEIDSLHLPEPEYRPDTTITPPEQDDSLFLARAEKFTINIYVDYGKLFTLPSDFERKAEAGIYFRFNRRWAIGAEGGFADITPIRPYRNGDTEASGIYYGGYIQYFLNIDAVSALFAGIGYSQGTYDNKISYTIVNEPWAQDTYEEERADLNASWASLRLGTEQKLNRYIALGGVFELRVKTDNAADEGFLPHIIPGYGKADSRTMPALNLYVKLIL